MIALIRTLSRRYGVATTTALAVVGAVVLCMGAVLPGATLLGMQPIRPAPLLAVAMLAPVVLVGPIALLVFQLVARLDAAEQALAQRGDCDPLTGVANRSAFMAAAEVEVARAHRYGFPVSLIMVDVDHFRRLNETQGHQAGDRALVELATVLAGTVRKSDRVSRYGGEEFVLLLPHTAIEDASDLAERLRHHVRTLGITCSFGVAGLRHEETLPALLIRLDRALGRAKATGRDRVVQADT